MNSLELHFISPPMSCTRRYRRAWHESYSLHCLKYSKYNNRRSPWKTQTSQTSECLVAAMMANCQKPWQQSGGTRCSSSRCGLKCYLCYLTVCRVCTVQERNRVMTGAKKKWSDSPCFERGFSALVHVSSGCAYPPRTSHPASDE